MAQYSSRFLHALQLALEVTTSQLSPLGIQKTCLRLVFVKLSTNYDQ